MDQEELGQAQQLLRCARRMVGPAASLQLHRMPVANAPVVAASSCAQVLKFFVAQPNHHILKLILDSTQEHLSSAKDGGWLFLQLALGIFLVLRGRGPLALEGLALSAQHLDIALQKSRIPFELQLTHVLALLRSVLCKPIALSDPKDVQHLSVVILEAFLHAVPGMDQGKGWPEVLRFEWFCGHDIEWSWTHHGLVLDTPGSIAQRAETSGELRLVLFDASLEEWLRPAAWGMETYTVETYLSPSTPVDALRRWEISQFKKLADSLLKSGVQVLCCQKLVDPWLMDYLSSKGVTILWRLSIRHIEFVRQLSGATPVTSLAALPGWQEVMGRVGSVELKRICQRDYVILTEAGEATAISTMLVSAPDDHALEELKQCLPQAVHCLWETVQSGFVLLGAGLTELQIAEELDRLASMHLLERCGTAVALREIASCFKDAAASLTPSGPESQCPSTSAAGAAMMDAASRVLQRWKEGSLPDGMVFDAENPLIRRFCGLQHFIHQLNLRAGEHCCSCQREKPSLAP